MCVVCALWEKGKLTSLEVDRAIVELITDESSDVDLIHAQEIIEKVEHEKNNSNNRHSLS